MTEPNQGSYSLTTLVFVALPWSFLQTRKQFFWLVLAELLSLWSKLYVPLPQVKGILHTRHLERGIFAGTLPSARYFRSTLFALSVPAALSHSTLFVTMLNSI